MNATITVWRLSNGSNAVAPLALSPSPSSLDEGTQQLPGGGYTTFRTFGRYGILRLADHFLRLEETAWLAGKPVQLDRLVMRQALRNILTEYPAGEMRVRIILDLEQKPGDVYFLVDVLHAPAAEDYQTGVRAVTRRMQRSNAKAKLTGFISTASTVRENIPAGIHEAVMVGQDGRVLEGLSSNFFAVLDGVIWTAEEDVLAGITRTMVLDAIHDAGFPLKLEGLLASDLPRIEEAFITSASRAVLPVTQIDGKAVGSGKPGPVAQKLLAVYQERLAKEIDYV